MSVRSKYQPVYPNVFPHYMRFNGEPRAQKYSAQLEVGRALDEYIRRQVVKNGMVPLEWARFAFELAASPIVRIAPDGSGPWGVRRVLLVTSSC